MFSYYSVYMYCFRLCNFGERLCGVSLQKCNITLLSPLHSAFILVVKMIHHSCGRETKMCYSPQKERQ